MEIYRVGGSVRDGLLGIPIKDKDYVVVGSSFEEMLDKGFICVGKSFPVFIHPETKQEYALARTERKVGLGYKGFIVDTENVSLEQDLRRRDITINSIAVDTNGKYIDPCNGISDINNGFIRHNTNAFLEDPLRILRVCRFLSKLYHFGFRIHETTIEAMKKIPKEEVLNVTPERIWLETEKVLSTKHPCLFFRTLKDIGKLEYFFPEIHALIGKTHNKIFHAEGDAFEHTLMVLHQASKLTEDTTVRFAALLHDIGKGVTPQDKLPKHHGHEEAGVPIVSTICNRMNIPNEYKRLAKISTRYHLKHHLVLEMTAQKILKLLKDVDAFRNPERLNKFLKVCEADYKGRLCLNRVEGYTEYKQSAFITQCKNAVSDINITPLLEQYSYTLFLQRVHEEKIRVIKKVIREFKKEHNDTRRMENNK